MPVMPPGNGLFRTYVDGNGRLQSQYLGPNPITCGSCGRTTYQTKSGNCAWCAKPLSTSTERSLR